MKIPKYYKYNIHERDRFTSKALCGNTTQPVLIAITYLIYINNYELILILCKNQWT